ncbi:MAG: hypothetical protein ACK4YP_16985 [Myxococcota bacterium]
MKKWLPYIVAAVLGVGVAVVAFGPGMSTSPKPKAETTAPPAEKKVRTAVNMGDDGFDLVREEGEVKTPAEVVEEAKANPPPPPGTLRPQNAAEIAHSARLERPFNKHYAYVASFWNHTARLVGGTHPDLMREASAMSRYMRDQGNLDGEELDVNAAIAKEKALVEKIRAAGIESPELDGVLDYIDESAQAVLDGKDPTTVLKPSQKAAAGQ